MKHLLTVKNVLIAIPIIALLAVLHYALPQVDVLRAVGVEIKRIDTSDSDSGTVRTRDVYHLQMETQDGEPRVYRNEDNIFYLKFDSADLQAQVQSFSSDKQLVALRHYGWRINVFSMFPNAVKVWPVDEGYRHFPVFNTIIVLGLAAIAFLIYRRTRRAIASARQLVETKRLEREAAAAERSAQSQANNDQEAKKKKQDELDAFLNNDGGN